METAKKKKKKEKRLSLLYILGGGILKEDFIVRHTRMIRLQQQLRDVRFEALSISSELTGNSRQSQIELLIEEQGIELEAAKNPPYELYK
jgi:Bacteriodetes cell division protein (FtsL-like)